MTTPPPPAGWYADPGGQATVRWWDGSAWSDHTSSGPALGPPSAPGGSQDVLGAPAPARKGKRGLLIGGAAAAVLAIGGGAFAYAMLSGGGPQPEDALPAGVVAYAEVDFDPAAGQKLAIFNLARRFPDLELSGEDQLKDDLLADLLGGELPEGLTYESDVAPWIGDRVGVGLLGELDEGGDPIAVFAVQHTGRDEAEAGLTRLRDGGADLAFAFGAEDYVIIAETQENADRAVRDAEQGTLSDDDRYGAALDALGGDQVATAYVDVEGIYELIPEAERDAIFSNPLFGGAAEQPTGQVVVGVSAGSDFLQVAGRTIGMATGPGSEFAAEPGTGLVEAMPDDSLGALSLTGVGPGLTSVYDQSVDAAGELGDQLGFDVFGLLDEVEASGARLPDDIQALFGDELAVGVFGETPDVGFRVRGGDPERAVELQELFGQDFGLPQDLLRESGGDLVGGSTPEAVDQVEAGGTLGESEAFRSAVPDADGAGLLLYVDVAQVVDLVREQSDGFFTEDDLLAVEPLRAVGLTATGGESPSFTLRITVE